MGRNKFIFAFLCSVGLLTSIEIYAQDGHYEAIFGKPDTLIKKDIRIYAGFVHQHQNFFNKAFSFQGIETGIQNKKGLLLGIYGSTFVSNLKIEAEGNSMYIFISQAGLIASGIRKGYRKVHAGMLLNTGFFSLTVDESDFRPSKVENPLHKLNGLVISPQILAEFNIANWFKLRTGFGYSFYQHHDQSIVSKEDLNNIFFSFGFIFGKFN